MIDGRLWVVVGFELIEEGGEGSWFLSVMGMVWSWGDECVLLERLMEGMRRLGGMWEWGSWVRVW